MEIQSNMRNAIQPDLNYMNFWIGLLLTDLNLFRLDLDQIQIIEVGFRRWTYWIIKVGFDVDPLIRQKD